MIARKDSGAPLLEARDLCKEFGPVRAVQELSFSVRRGEIVGLLGPNGAGKTTAMRMLIGYLVPTRGSVTLASGDIFQEGPRRKRHLGYLPENIPLYNEMTVSEYLEMTADLKGVPRVQRAERIAHVVKMMDLRAMWRRPAGQLSRGYRQRVGLAQALLTDPDLLILDEPATGLDPNQISEFRQHLRDWRSRKAILLSTHILAEALMLCDRVLILSRGRLVAEGTPQTLGGAGEGPVATQITLRGPRAGSIESLPEGWGVAVSEEPGERGTAIWRLEGAIDAGGRRALMQELARGDWDILEWNSGLSALEQVFRRLTLEEGE